MMGRKEHHASGRMLEIFRFDFLANATSAKSAEFQTFRLFPVGGNMRGQWDRHGNEISSVRRWRRLALPRKKRVIHGIARRWWNPRVTPSSSTTTTSMDGEVENAVRTSSSAIDGTSRHRRHIVNIAATHSPTDSLLPHFLH